MAQLNKNLYEKIARYFDKSREAISGADLYILEAVEAIVDITTSNYVPGDGSGSPDAIEAVNVEVALLNLVNASYSSVKALVGSTTPYLEGVKAVNNYVINNATTTGTSVEKLAAYVNSINWKYTSLDDPSGTTEGLNVVPPYWIILCTAAGYDTSSWRTEEE